MGENALMIVLRLVHILAGIFWAGGIALLSWFILPAQSAVGQAGMAFMQELMMRRRARFYITMAMVLTVLSGLFMYARLAMTTEGVWAASTTAKVLGVGALAAIIAGGIGSAVGRTAKKMAQLGATIQAAGGTPSEAQRAEMAALQARAQKTLRIVALLLVITVAAMASARYF
jgi:uncharacterized membrane protein